MEHFEEEEKDAKQSKKFVGNYEILKTIGEGSFAKVKLAIHRLTKAKVAIKVIDKTKLPDEYAIKNIHREAQIMRMMDHPNVLQLFEVMETKRNLFLILEYASGGELLDYIVSKGRLKEDEAKEFVRQICSALVDHFGLSNIYDPTKLLATSCGSPVYSAPEVIEGKKYVGPEVDAWSLGINIYAMVVGDLPFADSNLTALYEAILKGKYVVPEFVSQDCKSLLSKLLVINPKKRLTMSQVNEHPWLTDGTSFLEPMGQSNEQAFRPREETQLQDDLMEQLEQMGFERKQAVQSIVGQKFNQAAGTYYLLLWLKTHPDSEHEQHHDQKKLVVNSKGDLLAPPPQGHTNVTSDELANVLFQVERQQVHQGDEKDKRKEKIRKGLGKPVKGRLVSLKKNENASFEDLVPASPYMTPAAEKEFKLPHIGNADPHKMQHSDALGTLEHPKTSKKPPKGYKIGTIAIDETLYLPKEQDTYSPDLTPGVMGMPRTIRFAFNCTATTPLHPDLYFEKLKAILDKNEIEWYHDCYLIEGTWGDIKLEIEICKMPRLNSFGIRLKRIFGDIWEYKKLCSKITTELEGI
ncbi:kinase-like domain-containing protein [Gorgonomyces haynaldii]|nr:kinase-like domain-containing protein [Gorgonomyces haynaldii]